MRRTYLSVSTWLAVWLLTAAGSAAQPAPVPPPTAGAEAQAAAPAPPAAALSVEEQREFLAKAEFVKWKDTEKGVTQPLRVTLRLGDRTHDGAFQAVDIRKGMADMGATREFNFRDYFGYNIAAHQLACLLNRCDLVPAAVERTWRGKTGALVWWVEDVAMDESERVRKGLTAPSAWIWIRQGYLMRLFTELTGDIDRNQTNILITKDWRLVLIDFTRAFRVHKKAEKLAGIIGIEGDVYDGLRALTKEALKKAAGRWLTDGEIDAVLARRDALVAHFDTLIAEKGRPSVIYPPRTP